MRIRPMERNFIHSASRFLYHTHFYFNILSLTAKISARWLHCHEHPSCCSIVSCSPQILIGAHFSSHTIYQLHDLSLFKNMMKKRPCSEITAFKNSDHVLKYLLPFISSSGPPIGQSPLPLHLWLDPFLPGLGVGKVV
jgi:hypothetical protein